MGAPVQAIDTLITCVACGLTYTVSQGRDSCARCPLHEDCSTSCCPKCGTSNINPDKSRLARWLQKVLSKGTPVAEPACTEPAERVEAQRTLASVQPGCDVLITGYGNLSGSQRQHLQAYGLTPGRRVRVLAQRPVTIVQVEQTELAFESGIAARVLVGD
jgi:Fe2+ transport system protein FeoA/rubredoxin